LIIELCQQYGILLIIELCQQHDILKESHTAGTVQ
jgi:hypothetical protein